MNDDGQVCFARGDDGIAVLTLDRPQRLNAINLAMRDQLWTWLEFARDDPDLRCLIVRGAGDQAFCAGADVTEFGSAPSYLAARDARRQRDVWGLMATLPVPLVAAVQGWALGAGCELSLLCDIRVAAENARFGLPEVKLGYIPSAGGTQTLPRTIPRGAALGMILSGEPIDAATALQWGLVQRVVPRADLDAAARAVAERLAQQPPAALRLTREALRIAGDVPLSQGLRLSRQLALQALRAQPERATLAAWRPSEKARPFGPAANASPLARRFPVYDPPFPPGRGKGAGG
jgi:enoyl-CoA hydratase/carnithine racemase